VVSCKIISVSSNEPLDADGASALGKLLAVRPAPKRIESVDVSGDANVLIQKHHGRMESSILTASAYHLPYAGGGSPARAARP
jgi:hypothetical protein